MKYSFHALTTFLSASNISLLTHTHTHIYIYIYTHTHAHTYSQPRKSNFFSLIAFPFQSFLPLTSSQECGMLHYFLQWPMLLSRRVISTSFLLRKKYAPRNDTRITLHIFWTKMHTWNVQPLGSFDPNLTGRLFLSPQKFKHSTLRRI
jgi:hypothetical protein